MENKINKSEINKKKEATPMEVSMLFASKLYQGLILYNIIKECEKSGSYDILDAMATMMLTAGNIEAEA